MESGKIKKKEVDKPCAYCREPADTRDHIPTKNLFSSRKGMRLITVPSCIACNQGFQKEEEHFRMIMSAYAHDDSSVAKEVFNTKIQRQISRRPKLG